MSWATALLGKDLLVKENGKSVTKTTEEVLKNKKYVALYFSAHVRIYPNHTISFRSFTIRVQRS